MTAQAASPPSSPSASQISKGASPRSNSSSKPHSPSHSPKMSIDLSTVPPLVPPSPPTNTLIITNLYSRQTFQAAHLQNLHALLSHPTPLNSFSPLPSLHRLILSYPTTDAAIATRQLLESHTPDTTRSLFSPAATSNSHTEEKKDNTNDERIKIYFGAPTPLVGTDTEDKHLKAPSLGKLLFISPPPSPPCGWEIREEDPPNRVTHAEDLKRALAGLSTGSSINPSHEGGGEDGADAENSSSIERQAASSSGNQQRRGSGDSSSSLTTAFQGRGRRSTITVYDPQEHGMGEGDGVPSVMVEDTTVSSSVRDGGDYEDGVEETHGVRGQRQGQVMTHTARPPVELMEE